MPAFRRNQEVPRDDTENAAADFLAQEHATQQVPLINYFCFLIRSRLGGEDTAMSRSPLLCILPLPARYPLVTAFGSCWDRRLSNERFFPCLVALRPYLPPFAGEGILSWAKSLRIRTPRAEHHRSPRRLFDSRGDATQDSLRGSKSRSSLGSERVRRSVPGWTDGRGSDPSRPVAYRALDRGNAQEGGRVENSRSVGLRLGRPSWLTTLPAGDRNRTPLTRRTVT